MADPKISISLTIQHEGGFVDNSNDPGGATNMGVTQRDLPDADIRNLTVYQATIYYIQHYWKPFYSQIISQEIANKIFDFGVLFGIGTAVKILHEVLKIEGDIFGEETLAAVNGADPVSLLLAYRTAFVQHSLAIGAAKPSEREFVSGWIRRINGD